jgi:hypothetical protein
MGDGVMRARQAAHEASDEAEQAVLTGRCHLNEAAGDEFLERLCVRTPRVQGVVERESPRKAREHAHRLLVFGREQVPGHSITLPGPSTSPTQNSRDVMSTS